MDKKKIETLKELNELVNSDSQNVYFIGEDGDQYIFNNTCIEKINVYHHIPAKKPDPNVQKFYDEYFDKIKAKKRKTMATYYDQYGLMRTFDICDKSVRPTEYTKIPNCEFEVE